MPPEIDDKDLDKLPKDDVVREDDVTEGDESIVADEGDETKEEVDYTDKERNKSPRDSIRNAMEQLKEDSEEGDNKGEPKPVKKVEVAPVEHAEKPPTSFDEAAKKEWNKVPKAVVQAIAKRELEISNGFTQIASHVARVKELDKALAPYQQAIKSFGAPEAQVIGTLFQWMEALADPNKSLNGLRQLARNFNIDVSKLAPNTQETTEEDTQTTQQFDITSHPAFQELQGQLGNLTKAQETEKYEASKRIVDSWAADKTYFEKVRPHMFALLQSNTIPLKANGDYDLDAAYQAAVYANPETRELQIAENKAADAAKAKADAENLAKARQAKADKARKAGSSLKTAAPTGNPPNSANKSLNGNKPVSARDSIRAAMAELAENN